jgi:heme-degrading monooxygenase HmoA
MAEYKGRYTAKLDGDFVVFLIGARINKLLLVNKWLPVMRAMPRMLKELRGHPELGLLHVEGYLQGRTVMTVQYWRSFDQLHAYAHAKDKEHLPAWAAFNRAVGGNSSVGIFHETYLVRAGEYECVYANIPPMLLGKAGEILPATGRWGDARGRLRGGEIS